MTLRDGGRREAKDAERRGEGYGGLPAVAAVAIGVVLVLVVLGVLWVSG